MSKAISTFCKGPNLATTNYPKLTHNKTKMVPSRKPATHHPYSIEKDSGASMTPLLLST